VYLRYTPEGSEPQEWPIDLGKLRTMEVEAIEKVTGLDYGVEYKQRLLKGNGRARRALLWTLLRRRHSTLRFEDVDFADAELELGMDKGELAEMRKTLTEVPMDEGERAIALSLIDQQIETAPEAPGKALSPSGADATG